jgi:hypothetical protein
MATWFANDRAGTRGFGTRAAQAFGSGVNLTAGSLIGPKSRFTIRAAAHELRRPGVLVRVD